MLREEVRTQVRCHRAVPNGDVHLGIVVERPEHRVGRSDRRPLVVDDGDLRVHVDVRVDPASAVRRERSHQEIVVAPQAVEHCKDRRHPKVAPGFAMLDGLARYDNFLMAALAANRTGGVHADVYVHSKVAVIDDEWATIGSANAMFRSFYDDTEMNVTVWDRAVATDLRADLFAEHLGLL